MKTLGFSVTMASLILFTACSSSRTMMVNSGPSEAKVYLKGFNKNYFPQDKFEVGSTPLRLEKYHYTDERGNMKVVDLADVENENFYIIIEKENYESKAIAAPPFVHNINLNPVPGASVAKKILEEDRAVKASTLRITSAPTGAKVYIDNHLVGNSPYNAELKNGNYDIRINLPDHQIVNEKVIIDQNSPRSLHFDLLKDTRVTTN